MKRSQGSYYDMAGEQKMWTFGAKAKEECKYRNEQLRWWRLRRESVEGRTGWHVTGSPMTDKTSGGNTDSSSIGTYNPTVRLVFSNAPIHTCVCTLTTLQIVTQCLVNSARRHLFHVQITLLCDIHDGVPRRVKPSPGGKSDG